MSNKIISYITLHTLSSPWLGLGSVQVQVTQSQSTNTKSSGRAARHPSVEIERKNTVLGFPIEDEFLVLVNHWCFPLSHLSQVHSIRILAAEGLFRWFGWSIRSCFFGSFFRPTSDVNISKTVYPIYLKIKVQRVPTSHSSYINFQVNQINRFRDIDVESWPKKTRQ